MGLKKGVKDRRGEGRFMLRVLFLLFILLSLNLVVVSASSDVAYIYKKDYKVDENVLDVFSELGLSYELIDERYLPSDFSGYKLIFVGDERFKNFNKIPVNEKSSIIANYYFGEEFGLTDYDGVSQLAATAPLSVKKDNKVIQVYTKAKYNSISIPYYYLDDENKAPGMQTVARTYTGDKKDYDFGDVISYANPNTKLINGKYTEGKLCFFGIIESDYWTAAARQLFKDCVGFVATTCSKNSDCGEEKKGDKYCEGKDVYQDITSYSCISPGTVNSKCVKDVKSELIEECKDACEDGKCVEIKCYKDSDCNDNNDYTKDVCIAPGKTNSYCEHEPLECLKESDCGTDGFVGNKYCKDNAVFQDYRDFSCINNKCSNLTSSKQIEKCADICREGKCVKRECTKDSDCHADYYSEPYCMNNDSYRELHDFSCVNEMCKENIIKELLDDCGKDELCIKGECKKITCYKHADCGENRFTGNRYCMNGNVYEDFISFTCHAPGTIDSYCSNYTKAILIEYCEGECISGECITCFNNLSCGKDGFIGDKFCQDNKVYQDYQQFECINPATPESDCLSSIFPKLIKECKENEICVKGECKRIICYEDSDCDDKNVYTFDECNNPGTTDSYCSNTEINCINNNDCGITGFVGKEYCYKDDVFKDYQNSTCVSPGTKESYCNTEKFPKFLIDCGEDECGSWQNYCKGKDVYRNRSCYERACVEGGCVSKISVQEELVKECDFACENGECIGIHDVALIDFSNSIGGIRLEHINGTDILEDPAILVCNNKYKVYIEVKNLGGYYENVSFDGEVNGLSFNHEPKNNLAPEDYSLKYKTVNFTLPEGFYNITVEAIIPVDNVPENNFASRKIKIVCIKEPICGNGILEAGEECDDGNNVNGDGCSANCTIEKECCNDEDCPKDYYSETYCKDRDVYHDLHNFSCVNEKCEENIASELVEDCGESYVEDWQYYCQGNELYRKREGYEKGCEKGKCFSIPSVEDEFVKKCEGSCVNGECIDITCSKNSDCGTDGWLNKDYCVCTKEVWDYWQEFKCVNAGTKESYCTNSSEKKLKENCGEDYCDDWQQNYCKGKEVWKNKTCYDKGCKNGKCFNKKLVQEKFVEECDYECKNGECVGECEDDSDCHEDYYGENYCKDKDAYHDLHDFSCVNEKCEENVLSKLVEDCGESYCTDWQYYCECKDVWKKRTCYEKECKDGECYTNSYEEKEIAEKCDLWCWNGKCIECGFSCNCSKSLSGNLCKKDCLANCGFLNWSFDTNFNFSCNK